MRISKNILILILLLGIINCKKYENGPMFSLKSKTERVSNTWKVEKYFFNDNDLSSAYNGYTETYDGNGNFSYSWGTATSSGKWNFQNNYNQIKRLGISAQSSETLYILKLKEDEFWYYLYDGNDKKEFHMIPN